MESCFGFSQRSAIAPMKPHPFLPWSSGCARQRSRGWSDHSSSKMMLWRSTRTNSWFGHNVACRLSRPNRRDSRLCCANQDPVVNQSNLPWALSRPLMSGLWPRSSAPGVVASLLPETASDFGPPFSHTPRLVEELSHQDLTCWHRNYGVLSRPLTSWPWSRSSAPGVVVSLLLEMASDFAQTSAHNLR